MSLIRNYILVDDDPVHNAICSMLIKRKLVDVDITLFELPELGLDFIQHQLIENASPTILFLDINMPTLSGWDFMEQYEKFNDKVKTHLRVYILSSSVDQRDRDKAKTFPGILGYLTKPLDGETILFLAGLETGDTCKLDRM